VEEIQDSSQVELAHIVLTDAKINLKRLQNGRRITAGFW